MSKVLLFVSPLKVALIVPEYFISRVEPVNVGAVTLNVWVEVAVERVFDNQPGSAGLNV